MLPVQTRPSAAWRWSRCAAAPKFAALAGEQPPSEPAMQGICAAWLADLMLKTGALYARDFVGQECPENQWVVDLEMAGHVQSYVDMIRADGGVISSERHVVLSPLIEGTLDNCATFTGGIVKVRDLKYGFRLVEADTEQLVIYAGALVSDLVQDGHPVTEIWTEIYQPRGFHPDGIHRRVRWTIDGIWDRCRWLIARAEECHKPDPIATPGSHCLECDGAVGCMALQNTAINMITDLESSAHRQMSPSEIAARLTHLRGAKKVIDAAVKAVETEALTRHQTGTRIPNFRLKERFGHKKLNVGRKTIHAMTGIDPVKEMPMSPAELKAAGASEQQVQAVSATPTIGFKLEPLDPKDLQKQFPNLKG